MQVGQNLRGIWTVVFAGEKASNCPYREPEQTTASRAVLHVHAGGRSPLGCPCSRTLPFRQHWSSGRRGGGLFDHFRLSAQVPRYSIRSQDGSPSIQAPSARSSSTSGLRFVLPKIVSLHPTCPDSAKAASASPTRWSPSFGFLDALTADNTVRSFSPTISSSLSISIGGTRSPCRSRLISPSRTDDCAEAFAASSFACVRVRRRWTVREVMIVQ